jgi:hypothetical protein
MFTQNKLAFRAAKKTSLTRTSSKQKLKQAPTKKPEQRRRASPVPVTTEFPDPNHKYQSWDDCDADEKTLRLFDLDPTFGPCTGLSRLERYELALELGVEPAPKAAIKALLLKKTSQQQAVLYNLTGRLFGKEQLLRGQVSSDSS